MGGRGVCTCLLYLFLKAVLIVLYTRYISLTISLYHTCMRSQQGVNKADAKSGIVKLVVLLKLVNHHCFDLRRACCEDRSHAFRDSLLSKWVKWAFSCSFRVSTNFGTQLCSSTSQVCIDTFRRLPCWWLQIYWFQVSSSILGMMLLFEEPPERHSSRGCGPCVNGTPTAWVGRLMMPWNPGQPKIKRLQKPNWKRKTWGPGARVLWLALLQTLSLSNAADLSMDVQQKCLSSTIHVKVPGEVWQLFVKSCWSITSWMNQLQGPSFHSQYLLHLDGTTSHSINSHNQDQLWGICDSHSSKAWMGWELGIGWARPAVWGHSWTLDKVSTVSVLVKHPRMQLARSFQFPSLLTQLKQAIEIVPRDTWGVRMAAHPYIVQLKKGGRT